MGIRCLLLVSILSCQSQTDGTESPDTAGDVLSFSDTGEAPDTEDPPPVSECEGADVGTPCEDGNPCTVDDECGSTGLCEPGSLVSCVSDPENPCLQSVCDPEAGDPAQDYCVPVAVSDGPIEDACTVRECVAGAVTQVAPSAGNDCAEWVAPAGGCIDSYVCDAGYTDPESGSHCRPVAKANGTPCLGEHNGVVAGVKAASAPATADSPSTCSFYLCYAAPDPDTAFSTASCELAQALDEEAQEALGQAGVATQHVCGLADAPPGISMACNHWQCGCLTDECLAPECQALPDQTMLQQPCAEGDACTQQLCVPEKGGLLACEVEDTSCPPLYEATCAVVGACDPETGCPTAIDAEASDAQCVSSDPCVVQVTCNPEHPDADPVTGCVTEAAAPGSVCAVENGDACVGASTCQLMGGALACVEGESLECDDQDECTVDSCDPVDGCVHIVTDPLCGEGPDSQIVQLTVGPTHNCVLYGSGVPLCWGSSSKGKLVPPAGVLFKQLSAGNHHTCGIDTEDGLHCWGIDDGSSFDFGQVSDAPSGIFSSVAAGYNHTCALNAGKAVCWGITPDNLNAPEQAGYEKGQVTAIPENIHFARLVAGHSHTCGIRTDGGLECWGSTNGQKDVPAAMNFQQLAAGFHNNCAIDSNQQLQCWGWTAWGLVEAVPTGAFQSVGCGYGHCCAVRTTGEIACWGVPNNPVMGSGVQDKGQVTDAPTSGEYRFVGGGTSHSCAVTSQDKAVCWGGGAAVITQVPLELQ